MQTRPFQANRKGNLKSKPQSNNNRDNQYGQSDTFSLLLDIPVESLTHITSFLSPPSLLSLSRTNKQLNEHIGDDNTWCRAFVNQFLGIDPETDLQNVNTLLLRRSESTWRKEFIYRYDLRRRWERSRNPTITHSPHDSPIQSMHLMSENGLLTSSIKYGVVSRSLPLSGRILKGYLDASGTGLGNGNPNVEFTPNVSSCALTSDGGTARILWGYRNGDVAVTTANKAMDIGRASAKLVRCKIEHQHEGVVQDVVADSVLLAFTTASSDGRVKLWDMKTAKCLWTSKQQVRSLVVDPFVKVVTALSKGVIVGVLKSGTLVVWRGFEVSSSDENHGLVSNSIAEYLLSSPAEIDHSGLPNNATTTVELSNIYLDPSDPVKLSILAGYIDHPYAYRLQLHFQSGATETVRFGDPHLGNITSIKAVFSTQMKENSFLIVGDQLGYVRIYDWNARAPPNFSAVQPEHKFEAHDDGSVTSIAWNACVLVTGSARGTAKVWDSLTFEPLRYFPSPTIRSSAVRTAAGREKPPVGQILLERELLVLSVGSRVMSWKVGHATDRDRKDIRRIQSGSTKKNGLHKGQQQVEFFNDINESQRELQYEQDHSRHVYEREREQHSTLDVLGLDEIEAVEYVLMLSRDEEERRQENLALQRSVEDEGVFEGDFDLEDISLASPSVASSPTPSAPLSSRRSSSSSLYISGRSLPRVTVPISNNKIQVSPLFRPEPMEAGFSVSPLNSHVLGGPSAALTTPIVMRASSSSDHFPPISSSLSSVASTPGNRSIYRSISSSPEANRSAWVTPLRSTSSSGVPSPGSLSPMIRPVSTAAAANRPGFSLLSADMARYADVGTLNNLAISSVQELPAAEEMDDDLKFALELSLAEALSR